MLEVVRVGERLVDRFKAPAGLVCEEARYDGFRRRRADGLELHFWTQSRCLVTTAQIARSADFASAQACSRKRGWPVLVRRSGGGTVFHDPGVLCVSLFEQVPAAGARIERVYRRFCAVLTGGLSRLGVAAQVGPLPSAPCDGRFNILVGGRKLAGTAARIGFDRDGASVLAHAAIQVSSEFDEGLLAIASFERDLGRRASYDPECMTGLSGDPACERAASAIHEALFYRKESIDEQAG